MGKSERDPHLKPHPTYGNPQSGGVSQIQSFSLRIEGFMPHIRPPDPWDLRRRDEPPLPKCLTLKTKGGLMFRRYISEGVCAQTHSAWIPVQKQPFDRHPDYM